LLSFVSGIVTAVARRELARLMSFDQSGHWDFPAGDARPRLLYLHIPFCERLCPYCSFHRVPYQEALAHEYYAALRKEITLYRERGHEFSGAYVGGGTPTVLVDELEQTLAHAWQCFRLDEISVETNPNHLTEPVLASLKRAGVSRLSVGVQSFDDGLLRAMDRYEKYGSGADIAEGLKAAQGRFKTLNADMMFNLPGQDEATLERDLDILLQAELDQVTYYPLMVSDDTRQLVERTLGRVDSGREQALYRRIVGRLVPDYVFSSAWCFSRKTTAAIDEYIVSYGEYAGLGSGAIGYLNGTCYANTFDIGDYIARINRGESPVRAVREYGLRERIRYDFMTGLFATRLDVTSLRRKYGRGLAWYLWPDVLAFWLAGAVRPDGPNLRLTQRGLYIWVVMMREFFTAVNNFRDYCRRGVSCGETD
jgi:coproporphyrinogen III oxidase-like Fe-S oxidoreductase